jgi:anti-sigma-K factor RskA
MSTEMREKAVEYLLGELPPEAASRFEDELLADPALRAEVERLRPVVSRLDSLPPESWQPPEPPPLDLAAITGVPATAPSASVTARTASATSDATPPSAGTPDGDPPSTRGTGRRRSGSLFGGWRFPQVAVAAFSALVLLAAGTVLGMQLGGEGDSVGGPTETLALSTIGNEVPPDASGEVRLTGVSEGGGKKAVLDVSGLDPNRAGEFYELWLLGAQGELVALGSFRVEPDGASQIEVPVPVDPTEFQYFDVSIEPEDGSPDHSGRSVLRGLTKT